MSLFHYHGPLAPSDPLFAGRQDELRRLNRWYQGEVQNYVLLYGGRQTGKTSLLYRFEAQPPPGVRACRVDFQSLSNGDSRQAFGYLARQAGQALGGAPAAPPSDAPALIDFLCQALAQSNCRLLALLLEELGALQPAARIDLANTLRALFTNRYASDRRPLSRLQVILAGSIEMFELASQQASPLNNVCEKLYLPDLTQAEAEGLAQTALREAGLSAEAAGLWASAIYARVQGHPYLTQRLGAWLVEAWEDGRPLNDAALDEAAQALLCDDPLLGHLGRALQEYRLLDAAQELLSGARRFSRQDEDLARLELLGLARPQDGRWVVRNPLLRQAATLWLEAGPVESVPASTTNHVVINPGGVFVNGNVGGDVVSGEKKTSAAG